MGTNTRDRQDSIGSEDNCAICGDDDTLRLGFSAKGPTIFACYSCAPGAGQSPREWFNNEVRPVIDR